jgi:PI-3-kinase-related kinase SMG-1
VLWEDRWLDLLSQRAGDAHRRVQRLKHEAERVLDNTTLSETEKLQLCREKHEVILKPLSVAFNALYADTLARGAESPAETAFIAAHSDIITIALAGLAPPDTVDTYDPGMLWTPFEDLHENMKKASRRKLDLLNISPRLGKRAQSAIPMPGLKFAESNLVTIQSFSREVITLPSKTKPKKLVLVGSDGIKYSFLFKGLEDLHLDERMMQFLEIINAMFRRSVKSIGNHRARNYSVIPLGAQCGLIQWVDGTLPLFQVCPYFGLSFMMLWCDVVVWCSTYIPSRLGVQKVASAIAHAPR